MFKLNLSSERVKNSKAGGSEKYLVLSLAMTTIGDLYLFRRDSYKKGKHWNRKISIFNRVHVKSKFTEQLGKTSYNSL